MTNRYLAAVLSIAITLVAAIAATNQLSPVALIQLGILAVTSITTYAVPLIPGRYAAAVKVGLEAVGALLVAVIPFVAQGGISGPQVAIVILAVLKAVGAHVGVEARLAAAK